MSDNDEIKPGDRFERVGPGGWGVSRGDIYTALRPAITVTGGWFVEGSEVIWYLGVTRHWRRLPRTDAAPAAKVGDIVRDQSALDALPGEAVLQWGDGDTLTWKRSDVRVPYPASLLSRLGVRILALPEAPKAEAAEAMSPDATIRHALQILETGRLVGPHWWNAVDEPLPAPPPRCAPGCTPREPCLTDGVCPGWKEDAELHSAGSSDCPCAQCVWFRAQRGISADALPPARASATYQPRCAEFSGWGSWNGRAGK